MNGNAILNEQLMIQVLQKYFAGRKPIRYATKVRDFSLNTTSTRYDTNQNGVV